MPAAVALLMAGARPLESSAARMIALTLREISVSMVETCSSTAVWLEAP